MGLRGPGSLKIAFYEPDGWVTRLPSPIAPNQSRYSKRKVRQTSWGHFIPWEREAIDTTANIDRAACLHFESKVLLQPSYSPDFRPTDFRLLHSLADHFRSLTLSTDQQIRMWVGNRFEAKPATFWRNGIYYLVERRKKAVNNDIIIYYRRIKKYRCKALFQSGVLVTQSIGILIIFNMMT